MDYDPNLRTRPNSLDDQGTGRWWYILVEFDSVEPHFERSEASSASFKKPIDIRDEAHLAGGEVRGDS